MYFLIDIFVAMLPDCADEISIAPELSAPQLLLDLWTGAEDFSGRDALDYLHNPFRTQHRHTLHQEMHMILICTNLKKANLKALADSQTDLFKLSIYLGGENHSPILGRTYDVVQQTETL